MPAGTIALTNNSAIVTGTGTSFTTELKVNDFLVSTVGGLAYTLGVKSIESNTSLTLIERFTGPSASGQSWTPVPYGTMASITTQLAAQVTYAIRGHNLDKANWQQIFTGTGNITVTLPDLTTFTGPAWGGIANTVNNKADKSSLDNYLPKSGGTVTGRVSASNKDFGFGKLFNGWDSTAKQNQIWICQGESTAYYTFQDFILNQGTGYSVRLVVSGLPATKIFEFRDDGTLRSPGTVYAGGTALTSDARLKSNFVDVDYDLSVIDKIIPKYYDKQLPDDAKTVTRELGIVAQDLKEILPGLVSEFYWSEEYPDLLTVNYAGLSAWLTGYCKQLKDRVVKQDAIIAELQKRMKAIDGLDA